MKHDDKRSVFILAAGLGSRLKEMTSDKPKALVELNGHTLLEIVIDKLIAQDFNHFVINIHHHGDKIIDFLNKKQYNDILIQISDERDFLYDTGGGILKALPYFKDSEAVLIHNVDIVTDADLQSLYNDFVKSNDAAWLLTQDRDNKRKLVFDGDGRFVGRFNTENKEYDGDIEFDDSFRLLSFSGLHIIQPKHFSSFPLRKCYVFDLYKELAKNSSVKSKFIQPNYWFDLGTQEQIQEASSWFSSQK